MDLEKSFAWNDPQVQQVVAELERLGEGSFDKKEIIPFLEVLERTDCLDPASICFALFIIAEESDIDLERDKPLFAPDMHNLIDMVLALSKADDKDTPDLCMQSESLPVIKVFLARLIMAMESDMHDEDDRLTYAAAYIELNDFLIENNIVPQLPEKLIQEVLHSQENLAEALPSRGFKKALAYFSGQLKEAFDSVRQNTMNEENKAAYSDNITDKLKSSRESKRLKFKS